MKISLLPKACLMALMLPLSTYAYNTNDFVVKKIQLEGLNRISEGALYSDLPIHVGQTLNSDSSNEAIKSLFKTGYFEDVQLLRSGDALIVKVKERPAISAVNISGNSTIKTEDLKKGLTTAGLEVGNIYDPTLVKQIKQSLEAEYFNLGKYSVEIDIKTVAETRNRVAVNIHIAEGVTAKIRRIDIVGNTKYSQSTLLDNIPLTTPSIWNFWGWFTSSDEYSKERLNATEEALRSYYMDRGYLNFQVDSSQASLTPNKENTYVTFNISEGKIYHVDKVVVEGKTELPRDEIKKLLQVKPNEVFSRQKVMDTAKAITEALGDKGYAFAQVNPVPTVQEDTRKVTITFYVNPGKKVYVNKINFLGNNVTNDVVFRREMLFSEDSLYSQTNLDNSKIRLQRLPYVKEVNLKKVPVPNADDLIDLDYDIKERSANSVSASLGYSQLYGFIIGGNFNMPNIFGTGNKFSIGAQVSKPYKSLSFSYTDPYFTKSGISQTISAYGTQFDTDTTDVVNYTTNSYGFSIMYGIPMSNYDTFKIGGGYDYTKLIQPSDSQSWTVTDFVDEYGNDFNSYLLNLGWVRNTTNRAFFPDEGYIYNLGASIAVPGSSLDYYTVNGTAQFFQQIFTKKVVASLRSGVGYGDGYGNTDHLPFFKNYYGGGWGSVRGYGGGTLGPIDTNCESISGGGSTCNGPSEGANLGGNLNLFANLDILFPVPGIKDSSNMRLGVFADAGNVYDTYTLTTAYTEGGETQPTSPNFSNLRYSVGVEFRWLSPIGMMAFSFQKPLNSQPGDDTRIFDFSIGQVF
ncbi:outer membrane protein assembly factor BamA [Thiotrichales bacterium 19S3-7]|nr:outer membrane protein assembly factor BamA [Thiotrichales bacterium 19S3-7]MCF6801324.1 outer membrane protein assembly factor BamA [Thiotrichales bacterium 19S3-11]